MLDFVQKIDKVLEIKAISLNKLCDDSGLKTTLRKAYEDNREMRPKTTQEFLEKMKIRPEWWSKQEGEVFDENITSVPKAGAPVEITPDRYIKKLERLSDLQDKRIEHLEKELADLRRKA